MAYNPLASIYSSSENIRLHIYDHRPGDLASADPSVGTIHGRIKKEKENIVLFSFNRHSSGSVLLILSDVLSCES
jgi:hypothetical protein